MGAVSSAAEVAFEYFSSTNGRRRTAEKSADRAPDSASSAAVRCPVTRAYTHTHRHTQRERELDNDGPEDGRCCVESLPQKEGMLKYPPDQPARQPLLAEAHAVIIVRCSVQPLKESSSNGSSKG